MRTWKLKLTGIAVFAVVFALFVGVQNVPAPDRPVGMLPEQAVSSETDQPDSGGDVSIPKTPEISESSLPEPPVAQPGQQVQTPGYQAQSDASSAISKPVSSGAGKPSTPSKPSGSSSVTSRPSGGQSENTSSQKPQPDPSPSPIPAGKFIVGYYTGYSAYKGYTPQKVPASKLTHLNYAFAKIDPATGRIALADPNNDRKNFAAFRTLKQNNKHLNTLISVGGWDYSTYFSDVASTAARREVFAQSCLEFILEHGFDGVDLDWEFPVSGGPAGVINRPQDKQNFTLLLKAIREKLDTQEKRDGKTYYLTVAGAPGSGYLAKIEPKSVAALVDYIFLMGYDMHGPWDSYADFNAPLYQPTESSPQYKSSVFDGISSYLKGGISAKKIVLGMPFYGYLYQGVSSHNNGLYSKFSTAKSVSYDTVRNSYLNNTFYTKLRHKTAQIPYLYGNNTFITYEDPQSITAKATLAKSKGLGGVGMWELSHDTSGALLNAAYHTLNSRSGAGYTPALGSESRDLSPFRPTFFRFGKEALLPLKKKGI